MPITVKDVEHVADLAKLEISPEEKIKFQRELDRVIEYVDQLNDVSTENVPTTSQVIPPKSVLREDEVLPSLSGDQALANAPKKKKGFFRVPKVIG